MKRLALVTSAFNCSLKFSLKAKYLSKQTAIFTLYSYSCCVEIVALTLDVGEGGGRDGRGEAAGVRGDLPLALLAADAEPQPREPDPLLLLVRDHVGASVQEPNLVSSRQHYFSITYAASDIQAMFDNFLLVESVYCTIRIDKKTLT